MRTIIRYTRWAFWSVVYLAWFWREPNLDAWILKVVRTQKPWFKFKPCVWHNEDGRFWEIWFENDSPYQCSEMLRCGVYRSQDDGRIVGLAIGESQLRPKEKQESAA